MKEKKEEFWWEVALSGLGPSVHEAMGNVVFGLVSQLSGVPAIQRLVESLGGSVDALPNIAAALGRKLMGNEILGSDALGDFVRETIVRSAQAAKDAVRTAQGRDAEHVAVAKAVTAAAKEVAERKLVLDRFGHVHDPDCDLVQGQNFPTVTFLEAARRQLSIRECCRKTVTAAATVKVHSARGVRRSPMDVIGGMSERDQRDLMLWLATLPEDDRWTAVAALPELDTEGEFVALLAAIRTSPEAALFFLPLLKEKAEQSANLKQFLADMREGASEAAKAVAGFVKAAVVGVSKADTSLAPVAVQLREETAGAIASATKPVPWTLRGVFGL